MEDKVETHFTGEVENCSISFSKQQLTIEIPNVPDMLLINSPYNQTFPYTLPAYHNAQTCSQEVFSKQQNLQQRMQPGNSVSPNTPQMYVVNKTAHNSEGESDKSSEEDSTGLEDRGRLLTQPTELSSIVSTIPIAPTLFNDRNISSSDSEDSPQSTKKGQKKKNRTNYTTTQVHVLERAFVENPYPDSTKMESLANDLNIAKARIKIWFQNKRARFRKRTQGKHGSMPRPMLPPVVPAMGGYGFPPPPHPMLHGSHFQQMQNPYMYPGYPFGMSSQQYGFTSTPATQALTPESISLSSSPASSSSTSPRNAEVSPKSAEVSPKSTDNNVKAEISKEYSPFSHYNPSQIHPYMPLSFPFGAYSPYNC